MNLESLTNIPAADFAEVKPHAPGWWNGRLASYVMEEGTDKGGDRVVVTMFFTAEEPLEGQDAEHIQKSRRYPYRVRIYNPEDTKRITEVGKTLRPDAPTPTELKARGEAGGNIESYLDSLVNAPARLTLKIDDWMLEHRQKEVLVVDRIRRVA